LEVLCFHSGTRRDDSGALRTAGGRVLSIVATGGDHDSARASAYANLDRITFDGMHARRDIGAPIEVPA